MENAVKTNIIDVIKFSSNNNISLNMKKKKEYFDVNKLYYCPRQGDIASHEIGRKELKFFVFSSALPKSFNLFSRSTNAAQ